MSRPRRLRATSALRDLVAETSVNVQDLVAPLFVREGINSPQEITSLPGVMQHTIDSLVTEVVQLAELGIRGIILFAVPAEKDDLGSGAFDENGIAQRSLQTLRREIGDDLVLISDLCVDEYTSHGHCGVLDARGEVDNDKTLEIYQRIALAQAHAGAHMVAPSGMMDGQVGAIRAALDAARYEDLPIMAYSAKYASALYGPFRDAVDVQIANGGHRRGYQQDVRNVRESMREVAEDIEQGADIVMVKPALAYLDVIREVRQSFDVPVAAYHVSGEYSMIKAASERGWVDHDATALEHLTSIKRAGADIILTYFARWFAETCTGTARNGSHNSSHNR